MLVLIGCSETPPAFSSPTWEHPCTRAMKKHKEPFEPSQQQRVELPASALQPVLKTRAFRVPAFEDLTMVSIGKTTVASEYQNWKLWERAIKQRFVRSCQSLACHHSTPTFHPGGQQRRSDWSRKLDMQAEGWHRGGMATRIDVVFRTSCCLSPPLKKLQFCRLR